MSNTVANYLIYRLRQAGIEHAFGVPGDYVLTLIDRLIETGVEFIGTCNELNAGYAADAYARVRGLGCVCVTWGVGGFSTMNAVAGAYAEQVPLVVVVGGPRREQRRSSMLLHHSVGETSTMRKAYSHITAAAVVLDNPATAPGVIDSALKQCLAEKRPVLIEVPADMVDEPCRSPRASPLATQFNSDPDALSEALDETMSILHAADRAVILGGVELHRYKLMNAFLRLVDQSRLPVATTLLGKTVISEHHPQAIGVYEGRISRREIRDIIENADVLFCLGAWISDISLGFYTGPPTGRQMILANSGRLRVSQHIYENVWIGDIITGVTDRLTTDGLKHPPFANVSKVVEDDFEVKPGQRLTMSRLMKQLNSFIGEDFTFIAETGDAIFAAADLVMHNDVGFIGQAFYLSIGYALPATLGAAVADPARRPISLIGDGAFQMSAQELSTLCRRQTNAIILLLNNDGYTTERIIHEGPYNDIQAWEYHKLPDVFGSAWGRRVETEDQLAEALKTARATNEGPALIEIMLGRFDTSEALKRLCAELSPDRAAKKTTQVDA